MQGASIQLWSLSNKKDLEYPTCSLLEKSPICPFKPASSFPAFFPTLLPTKKKIKIRQMFSSFCTNSLWSTCKFAYSHSHTPRKYLLWLESVLLRKASIIAPWHQANFKQARMLFSKVWELISLPCFHPTHFSQTYLQDPLKVLNKVTKQRLVQLPTEGESTGDSHPGATNASGASCPIHPSLFSIWWYGYPG